MNVRRKWLLPLLPVYATALEVKDRWRDLGWTDEDWLTEPVISVGSVSAGGAGKTPMVLLLAELLQRRGLAPQILTRGYKRSSWAVEQVELTNSNGDAARFGDEPVLLAQRSGAPVYVGRSRFEAGLIAEGNAPAHGVLHLLDDGFQHRQLGRDVDLVLVTQRDLEDVLLPAGNLREPLAALRRADIIIVRADEPKVTTEIARYLHESRKPVIWSVRRVLSDAGALPQRPLVFCGIARPEGFVRMLREAGCEPREVVLFGDHHAYRASDIEHIAVRAQAVGADGIVTTEKDAVKLSAEMRARLESVGMLVVPRLELQLADADAAIDALLAVTMERHRIRLQL